MRTRKNSRWSRWLLWFGLSISVGASAGIPKKKSVARSDDDRTYWVETVCKIAGPVLQHLSEGTLRQCMPVEQHGPEHPEYRFYGDRSVYAHLEAVGRTLCGIAPWLELPPDDTPEGKLRKQMLDWAVRGLTRAVDPLSADYLSFRTGSQSLVDAAFLAQAFLRSPRQLWGGLDGETQRRLIRAMKETRRIRPAESNWLMFSAIIEAFLKAVGEEFDLMRIDYALRQHEQWYKGDGVYGDGPDFHWDYYNSYVIQPMLVDVVGIVDAYSRQKPAILKRSARYAAVLERLISPEGTFPPLGRSLLYRTGAFQSLSQMALLKQLPEELSGAQVRCALTAVIRRMFEQPDTFNADGWLTMGFCGHQPAIGEAYTCTGSLYLCTTGFLALGLPADDPFWTAAPERWTSCKAWSGEPFPIDHAIGR